MSESCFIVPCVKNSKNEDVPSKLFEDLWKISGNYNWAEQQYKVATDESFLSSVDPIDVVLDKNGQIDARSFLNITGVTFTSDEIKQRLSKKWEDSKLSSEEVPDKVSQFNAEEELKDDFVPVILPNEGGNTVKFTLSQRTPNRSAALQTYLENNKVIKIISDRLRQLGVAYDFVGKEKYAGRFSTENAQKAFDGLYHLIEISKGSNIEDVLVEESAHLATVACKDSVFINRLLQTLDNRDILNSLFTPEELAEADLNTEEGKLELAGKLVAKSMRNQLEGNYKGFLNRVKQSIYRVFAKSDLKSLLTQKQQARVIAETLAHGFLVEDNFSIDTALKSPATLYSTGAIPEENKLLKGTLDKIRKLGARVDNFSKVAYKDVYQKLTAKSLLGERDLVSISEEETLSITASAVQSLMGRLTTLTEPLTAITEDLFDKDVDIDIINAIFEAEELVKTLQNINNSFQKCKLTASVSDDFLNGISSLIDEMSSLTNSVEGNLNNYIRWYSVALLRESIGREAIDLASDVYTNKLFSQARIREGRQITVSELANSYIDRLSDTSSVLTFFRTYSNHKDVTTQVFYDIVRKSKAKEAIQYNNEISELQDIENDYKKLISSSHARQLIRKYGFDPDTIFYERTEDGKLTGWFISDIKRGQFESDKRKMLKEVTEQFRQELENGTMTLSDGSYTFDMRSFKNLTRQQRYNVFQDYKHNSELYIKFYDEAYTDRKNKIFKDKYINYKFLDLCKELPELKELYDKVIEYKQHIDTDYLTDQTSGDTGGMCHGVARRLPQFKASFINKIKNKKQVKRDLSDTSDLATYCTDVTSDNFGSPITESPVLLNEEDENLDLDKLALYGINLLDNMEDLSTDLFKSLDKYTEMACRFHSSQEVATRLELFDDQLSKRYADDDLEAAGKDKNAARISSQQRRNIMKRLVYRSNKGIKNFSDETWLGRLLNKATNFKSVMGAISAFGAIRALCISPIAGIKNYVAGLRIFIQDVSSGVVEGVTLKDVVKQTFVNIAPKHIGGEIARVLFGKTATWDQYQKLIDRWDSYRTPSKITRRKGFLSLQTLVNIIMANYSVTDNALIGIIYNSMLKSKQVYDAEAGRLIDATKIYGFNSNGNPYIRAGILKSKEDEVRYKLLKDARQELAEIKEENSRAEDDINLVVRRVQDTEFIPKLEDFYNSNGENLDIYNESGGYKSIDEIEAILSNEVRKISFNEDDEYKLCNGINDYIISSQGVYGMLNATEFQSSVYTQSLGKIKGYMFGYIQRNYFSNYSISSNEYKHAMLDSLRLALWSVFSNKELVKNDDISRGKYAWYTLQLMVLPPALRNKELMKHMQRCGWDPDQLKRVTSMCLGFWINLLLGILCRSLYRGNEKSIGEKVYRKKGKLPLETSVTGLSLVYPWLGENKVITPGALAPKRAITVDVNKAQKQYEDWSKPTRKLQYPKNIRDYSQGAFIPGTDEFNDRVQSYYLRNTVYDNTDPLYYVLGAAYRLSRGVRDEGITLMNPIRFAGDLIQMGDYSGSIMFSSGLHTLWSGIESLAAGGEKMEKWNAREAKFWLNKIGFTYDSTPEIGMGKVQPIDWYDKQEVIDRYQQQQQPFDPFER